MVRSGECEGDLNVELRGGEARNDDVERPCRRISWIARSLPTDSNFSYITLWYCRMLKDENVTFFPHIFTWWFSWYFEKSLFFPHNVTQLSSCFHEKGFFFFFLIDSMVNSNFFWVFFLQFSRWEYYILYDNRSTIFHESSSLLKKARVLKVRKKKQEESPHWRNSILPFKSFSCQLPF